MRTCLEDLRPGDALLTEGSRFIIQEVYYNAGHGVDLLISGIPFRLWTSSRELGIVTGLSRVDRWRLVEAVEKKR